MISALRAGPGYFETQLSDFASCSNFTSKRSISATGPLQPHGRRAGCAWRPGRHYAGRKCRAQTIEHDSLKRQATLMKDAIQDLLVRTTAKVPIGVENRTCSVRQTL